jgi:hypothetical protein
MSYEYRHVLLSIYDFVTAPLPNPLPEGEREEVVFPLPVRERARERVLTQFRCWGFFVTPPKNFFGFGGEM